MVNKPFLLLGLAAEYRSRRRRRWCANNVAADRQMFTTLAGELSWQRLQPLNYTQKAKKSLFEPPFSALWANVYALHLWLVGKPVVDFIFVVIELFSLSPTVETLWAEIGRSRRFSKGVGHFERRFQIEEGIPSPHQPLLVSEN